MGRKRLDLTGKKIGSVRVEKSLNSRRDDKGRDVAMWLCRCSCGNMVELTSHQLSYNKHISCGHCGDAECTLPGEDRFDGIQYIHNNPVSPYEDLATAIVVLAADDYRQALRGATSTDDLTRETSEKELKKLKKFFNSEWFKTLSSFPANKLLSMVNDEVAVTSMEPVGA